MRGQTFNDLYSKLVKDVLTGEKSSPRGMEILEKIGYQFTITDPNKALCTINGRKLNYAFAIIEAFEYLYGQNDANRLCFYNSNMRNFTNSTGSFDGAYAPRIKNQLEYVYKTIKKDPDTRQAVIVIRDQRDMQPSRDVPCTLSLQFLLRQKKLHCVVTMRSNDLLWGTPYDVNGFTLIQKNIARWLGVEVGDYVHQAGSLHVYLNVLSKFDFIYKTIEYDNVQLPQLEGTYEETMNNLKTFFWVEESFRKDGTDRTELLPNHLKPYFDIVKNYVKRQREKSTTG